MSKRILLLGASGNIGLQTLDIIKAEPDFALVGISVGKNINRGLEILKEYPTIEIFYSIEEVNPALRNDFPKVKFFNSKHSTIASFSTQVDYDMMVNALVGFAGLEPTIQGLNQNKIVALANKESLVVGGELINKLLDEGHGTLVPIDSEHVAIDKCILKSTKPIKNLVITASGGSFRKLRRDELTNVTKDDALKHPTWNMGAKITIDSASMMNKCFEVIEAHYLFRYDFDHIKVMLHEESMIHSLIEYTDGTFLAEISYPDMHNPIKYALYERNIDFDLTYAPSIKEMGDYHNHEFDIKRYPLIRFAKYVMDHKGLSGCVLNASNEVAVYAFLNDEINFLDIDKVIEYCMEEIPPLGKLDYASFKKCDEHTRAKARDYIRKLR